MNARFSALERRDVFYLQRQYSCMSYGQQLDSRPSQQYVLAEHLIPDVTYSVLGRLSTVLKSMAVRIYSATSVFVRSGSDVKHGCLYFGWHSSLSQRCSKAMCYTGHSSSFTKILANHMFLDLDQFLALRTKALQAQLHTLYKHCEIEILQRWQIFFLNKLDHDQHFIKKKKKVKRKQCGIA